jgi:hypothetical protein
MRQHPQTTERDARRRFAGTIHQPANIGNADEFAVTVTHQAAIDRHAWRIFQSYLPEVERFRGRRRLAEGQRVTKPQQPGGIGRP